MIDAFSVVTMTDNDFIVGKGVWIEGLSWIEAEAVFNNFDTVMIPLGARTKEHGPHLPLNNDWIMAEYLARRVAEKVPVIVMPTIQYGYYPSFLEYPGSVIEIGDVQGDDQRYMHLPEWIWSR